MSNPYPALVVFDAGYTDLVPIVPPDAELSPHSKLSPDQRGKAVGVRQRDGLWSGLPHWQDATTSRKQVANRAAYGAGFGLKTRHFPTIDVDVLDLDTNAAVWDVIVGLFGAVLRRTGRPPKFAVPFRTDQPFSKIVFTLKGQDGTERGKVEILGDGQQFVVHGVHPGTGQPYVWTDGNRIGGAEILAARPPQSLPVLTPDLLTQRLVPALQEALAALGLTVEQKGDGRKLTTPPPDQANLRAPNLDELRTAVAAIPNAEDANRDDFVSMGYAIKAAGGPEHEPEPFEIFLDWCDRWEGGYNEPEYVRATWEGLKPPFRIGWGWLLDHAREHGYGIGAEFTIEAAAATGTPASAVDPLPPTPPDDHRTDMGNAGRFVRSYRNLLRNVRGRGWFVWNGRRWALDESSTVERMAKAVVRKLHAEVARIEDPDERKHVSRWAFRSEAKERIRAMVDLAASELPLAASQLDANSWLLNVENGTVDLRTGTIHPHDPAQHLSKLAPVTYDPSATAPTWDAFLDRIFGGNRDLIAHVQRAVGYTLVGNTSEQVLFFLHGTGANGKTTFLEALRYVFGDYATQAAFSTFLTQRHQGPRNDLARLQGARFLAAAEINAGAQLDESVVKQLTGGDAITARYLYKEAFEFHPQFTIWLAANHKPTIRGTDHAIWRRISMIPFTVTIPEEERDPALIEKLKTERDGILRWAIEGCLAWQRDGLQAPEAVRQATEGYRAEMDGLAAFVQERCLVAPEVQVRSQDLYDAYLEWSRARQEVAESQRAFNERLAAHDPARFKKLKTGGVFIWRGIELRAEVQEDGIAVGSTEGLLA